MGTLGYCTRCTIRYLKRNVAARQIYRAIVVDVAPMLKLNRVEKPPDLRSDPGCGPLATPAEEPISNSPPRSEGRATGHANCLLNN